MYLFAGFYGRPQLAAPRLPLMAAGNRPPLPRRSLSAPTSFNPRRPQLADLLLVAWNHTKPAGPNLLRRRSFPVVAGDTLAVVE